jgi:hypothetical protein
MAYGFHRLRHDVGKAAVDVNPPSVAESPCRRVAESPSRRIAVSPPELTAFPNSSIYPTAFAGQLTPQP